MAGQSLLLVSALILGMRMMSQEAGKLVVVWLSRHAALLPNKGGALRDETITVAKETPMVVSSPGAVSYTHLTLPTKRIV